MGVCVDELNTFAWPGYGLRPIPGTREIVYGALPRALFEQVRRAVLTLHRARLVRQTPRD